MNLFGETYTYKTTLCVIRRFGGGRGSSLGLASDSLALTLAISAKTTAWTHFELNSDSLGLTLDALGLTSTIGLTLGSH